jgi:hypothetical protein
VQEVEIDCKPCGFWSRSLLHQVYFQAQQSTIEKAEEEFLDKRCFSQAQNQAADLCICLPTRGTIRVVKEGTKMNLADLCTKILPMEDQRFLLQRIMY